MSEQYHSGDDIELTFLELSYSFSRTDFTQRVVAAAVRLDLLEARTVTDEEAADLVDLVAHETIAEPRSALGAYLERRGGALDPLHREPLGCWVRETALPGAGGA